MRKLELSTGRSEIYSQCKKACITCDLEILEENENAGFIKAFNPASLLSFGNKVIINVIDSNGKTTVTISSTSAAQIQLFDWGTNIELEKKLARTIEQST